MRLKIDVKRRDQDYFAQVAEKLAGCREVTQIETNPLTGSVLILGPVSPQVIGQHAAQQGLFQLASLTPEPRPLVEQVVPRLREASRSLQQLSGGSLDWNSLLFLALVGLAIHQALEGNVMAPAITLLWYALSILWAGAFAT
jgi:hypothetical protein